MLSRKAPALALAFFIVAAGFGAEPGRVTLQGHVSPVVPNLTPIGLLPGTNILHLAIGLPLRNRDELDDFLHQLHDPRSANFHKFLKRQDFKSRFDPTEQDYEAVMDFARTNGLTVTASHDNRLLLDVSGTALAVEKAFHITLRVYRHPTEARNFFAPDTEPSVLAGLPVADIEGLSDYSRPHPKFLRNEAVATKPKTGSAPDSSGDYFGNDFRNAYLPGVMLTGAGQTVGVLEFDGFYPTDIMVYAEQAGNGRTNIAIQTILLDSYDGTPTTGKNSGNPEVSLDIEIAMAMAPGLSKIISFEAGPTGNPNDILNSMLTYSNTVNQLSCSWGWSGGPSTTTDNIFISMDAVGQSFLNASGDSDAFTTGAASVNGVDNTSLYNSPSSCPYITQVGGTDLNMSGSGSTYTSETVWNQSTTKGIGSSGGISSHYTIPSWQTNISNITGRGGSTVYRNIPDVAMSADEDMYIVDGGNGQGSDGWGGTSFAAPMWAGFMALVNQQAAAVGNPPPGFINPAIYNVAAGVNYSNCFHDITSGNNTWRSSSSLFHATNGYDLCTGLGSPKGQLLINILASYPYITTQPAGQTVTNGNSATFSVTASGQSPFGYYWLFNGTNLPASPNVSGNSSNVLTVLSVTATNAGNYSVVITNTYGSATSSVAALVVISPPLFGTQPTNLTVLAGSSAVFTAIAAGTSPLAYRWLQNGTNLLNGGNISGATSNMLTLTAVTTNSAGNYDLYVTNLYGSATSSAASLTILLPPAITTAPSPQTVQCGSNNVMFTVAASGMPPLNYQWSLDGAAIAGATNTSLSLTNVHLPNHTVAVIVTNLYNSATSSVTLTVQDTIPPVITLNGVNPYYLELGSPYVDPGATANSLCVGSVPVTASGTVNTNAVSTNTITYTATDGQGNTNTATRTVIVRDTTPPIILWSFTNLTVAAVTNCEASMTNVTGTNFIRATDLSGTLIISQSPTNNAILPLGTNIVIITVADASSNTSYSTNQIIVADETPPLILTQPQPQTNGIGGSASFNIAATACTPVTLQWFFGSTLLAAQTNGTLTLSNLTPTATGNYSAVATASGGSTTSVVATLTVDLFTSSVVVASSENPSGFNDGVNFTASVTPTNVTGTVEFLTNGTDFDIESIVTGTATSTNTSLLPRGTNIIAAVYSGDANDLPVTNTLEQIVTNHPPIGAPVYYTRLAGYRLDIALTDLATNWTDPDGDTVSLAAVGVSTNGVTVTNDDGALVYFDTNNVDDQFVCTISDGWGGTNFETVNVTITLTNTVPTIGGVANSVNGGVTLSLGGAPGYTYILETTTNLTPPTTWIPVTTNTLGSDGIWQFTDTQATDFSFRLYRLMLAP